VRRQQLGTATPDVEIEIDIKEQLGDKLRCHCQVELLAY
jgi:hypothetical protein